MALIASFSSRPSTISPSSNNFSRMQLAQSRNLITALLIFITDGLVQARRYCNSEDELAALGRVLIFHGIKFTAKRGEMALLP